MKSLVEVVRVGVHCGTQRTDWTHSDASHQLYNWIVKYVHEYSIARQEMNLLVLYM